MRAGSILLVVVALLAVPSELRAAELEQRVQAEFDDTSWYEILVVLRKLLKPAELAGATPPNCSVTIQTAAIPLDRFLNKLTLVYGIVFVQRGDTHTIHLPRDTDRMCSVNMIGG